MVPKPAVQAYYQKSGLKFAIRLLMYTKTCKYKTIREYCQ